MENFFGTDYTPHGDTHLRTVQKYSAAAIQTGFDQSIENLLDAVNHLQILQPPVTVAIDITTWPYHAEDNLPAEVNGTKRTDETAYKFATLSLIGKSMPIVLAFEPVIESSEWDDNPGGRYDTTGPVAAGDTVYVSSGDAVHAFAMNGGVGSGRYGRQTLVPLDTR